MAKKLAKRNSGKGKAGKDLHPVWIVVIALGLVIGFIATRKRQTESAPRLAAKEPVPAAGTQPSLVHEAEVTETSDSSPNFARARRDFAAATLFGIDRVPATLNGDSLTVNLRIEVLRLWCQAGDLDTIRESLQDRDNDPLLISIEGLRDGSNRQSFALKYPDLSAGLKRSFRLKGDEDTSFGVFICSDQAKTGKCQGKRSISHKKLNEEALEAKGKRPDKIFYYQNLILKDKELVAYDRNSIDQEKMPDLKSFLKTNLKQSEGLVEQSDRLSDALRSTRLQLEKDAITLFLPANDLRCLDLQ